MRKNSFTFFFGETALAVVSQTAKKAPDSGVKRRRKDTNSHRTLNTNRKLTCTAKIGVRIELFAERTGLKLDNQIDGRSFFLSTNNGAFNRATLCG
ncbi:MAG: hypothetical protein H6729_13150 [Deltaproteobacteria bacterium]|nr:hypothetical protein [Deltaproteobacteria bacterium]